MSREQEQLIRDHWRTKGDTALAAIAGLSRHQVFRYRVKHGLVRHDGEDPTAFEHSLEVPYIATPEDLLRVMQVDGERWEIAKLRVNAWGKDGQHHQVRAELKPRGGANFQELKVALLKELAEAAPPPEAREYLVEGCLKEVSIPDLHLGKAGHGYSADVAEALFRRAVTDLLQKSASIPTARFLLPVSNDFLHADNQKHQTTAGTQMDVDVPYVDMFRRGWRLLRWAIEELLKEAPVDVVVVPGNHDYESGFAMGELLGALYEDHFHVTVDNRPVARKYYDFGTTLLGFAHGNDGQLSELPLTMADEAPEQWARCPYREWHLGHKHRKKEHRWVSQDEFRGVRVRELPSLSPADRWHHRQGYNHWRAAEMYVWHPEESFVALFSFNGGGSGREHLLAPE